MNEMKNAEKPIASMGITRRVGYSRLKGRDSENSEASRVPSLLLLTVPGLWQRTSVRAASRDSRLSARGETGEEKLAARALRKSPMVNGSPTGPYQEAPPKDNALECSNILNPYTVGPLRNGRSNVTSYENRRCPTYRGPIVMGRSEI